jgi:hypothetical protein
MLRPLFSRAWLSIQILHESSTAPSHIDFHRLVVFDQGRARVAEVCVQLLVAAPSIVLGWEEWMRFLCAGILSPAGKQILRSKHNAMGE